MHDLEEDECYKINTGAPVPHYADCIVQVEDTKLLKRKKTGEEDLVEILVEPQANLDIRYVRSGLLSVFYILATLYFFYKFPTVPLVLIFVKAANSFPLPIIQPW